MIALEKFKINGGFELAVDGVLLNGKEILDSSFLERIFVPCELQKNGFDLGVKVNLQNEVKSQKIIQFHSMMLRKKSNVLLLNVEYVRKKLIGRR